MSIAVLKVALMEKGRCSAVSALNFFLVEPPLSRGILHEWHAPLNQLANLQRRSGLVRSNCAQLPRYPSSRGLRHGRALGYRMRSLANGQPIALRSWRSADGNQTSPAPP